MHIWGSSLSVPIVSSHDDDDDDDDDVHFTSLQNWHTKYLSSIRRQAGVRVTDVPGLTGFTRVHGEYFHGKLEPMASLRVTSCWLFAPNDFDIFWHLFWFSLNVLDMSRKTYRGDLLNQLYQPPPQQHPVRPPKRRHLPHPPCPWANTSGGNRVVLLGTGIWKSKLSNLSTNQLVILLMEEIRLTSR